MISLPFFSFDVKITMGLPDGEHLEHDRQNGRQDEGLQLDQEARLHPQSGWTFLGLTKRQHCLGKDSKWENDQKLTL